MQSAYALMIVLLVGLVGMGVVLFDGSVTGQQTADFKPYYRIPGSLEPTFTLTAGKEYICLLQLHNHRILMPMKDARKKQIGTQNDVKKNLNGNRNNANSKVEFARHFII